MAEGGAHQGGSFPPFDSANFAPQLIWLVLVFAVLYLLMSRIALPRVADILENRRARIAQDVLDADKMQREASEASDAHEKSINDARAKAQAMGQAQRDKLAAESDTKRKAVEASLNAKLVEAEANISATKSKAMESVHTIAQEAAGVIVQQILGRTPRVKFMELDAEFFVAAGFVLFVAMLAYLGVHKTLTTAIDERAKKITAELGEALRLRTEAQAILASFQKKAQEAEADAVKIVAQAKAEAEALAKEAEIRAADFVTRRTAQAEQKIAQAEAQAQADVKAAAADAAVRAAEIILKAETTGDTAAQFLNKGIANIKASLRV
eukprot:gene8976-9056_t